MDKRSDFRKRPGSGYWVVLKSLRRIAILLISGVFMISCAKTETQTVSELVGTEVSLTLTSQSIQQLQEKLNQLETEVIQATQAIQATQTVLAIQPSVTPTLATPTLTPTTPTLTPTATLTFTPVTPTNTPTATYRPPTPAPLVLVNDVHFKTGGTSAYYQKNIHSGERHIYQASGQGGQTLIVTASSPGNDVYLDIKGVYDGQQLLSSSVFHTYWSGTLPKGQPYQITLTTSNPSTYYFLSIEIPANIFFATGTYSTSIDGYIEVDSNFYPDVLTRVRYLAWAAAGQTMTVKLTSPNLEALSLGIYGQSDGQAYLRYEVKNNGGKIVLPASQGYFIDVYAVKGKSTAFTLEVFIR
jgi:hypothetical protein